MELSDTESDALYDNGHEQNKIKVDDCITSINVCIQWALENEKPTTALYELRDSAVKNSLKKKQLKISNFHKQQLNFKNYINNFGCCYRENSVFATGLVESRTSTVHTYIIKKFLTILNI